MKGISEEKFREVLGSRLGDQLESAMAVFKEFTNNSLDVTNVLLWAVKQGPEKVDEVLAIMKAHAERFAYTHPQIRGLVSEMGVNPTTEMFKDIYVRVLDLKPVLPSHR